MPYNGSMLKTLNIRNFGLIDELEIDLTKGLNVLTGSTGAGKSIIIDALRFLLGDRIKSSQVRDPQKPCSMEALFELEGDYWQKLPCLEELLDESSSLLIQRQHFPDGRTKVKLNGMLSTVGQLKEIGDHLIDFHGANDHQMLLVEESHLSILDQLTDFKGSLQQYEQTFQSYAQLRDKLKAMDNMAASRERDLEMLDFQIKELDQVTLSQEAYDELSQSLVKCENAQRLCEQVSALKEILDGDEGSLGETARKAFAVFREVHQVDEMTAPWGETLGQIQELADQLGGELRDYADGLSFEPGEAEELNRKYDIYQSIQRKYGRDMEEAARFYAQAKERYALLIDWEHNDKELRAELARTENELKARAKKLTEARRKTAARLKSTIEAELKDLGFDHVEFEVKISKSEAQKSGTDQVSFYISPNTGESLKPLSEIVSSGEAARLMLALKRALVDVDPIPVLIFDEIDAQIGGRLGKVTGHKLKSLAANRQVILITHLPQIASFGDRHFKVSKQVRDGRTVTAVQELAPEARLQELAQMMSGKQKSALSLDHAQEMLATAQKS